MADGKHEFYSKAEDELTAHGYRYFNGDRDITGKEGSTLIKPIILRPKETR